MELVLPVAGGGGASAATGASVATGDGDDAASASAPPENADAYTGDKPPLELRDPAAPKPSGSRVHELTLETQEVVAQVSEGVWQQVWTFNGQVPGPTMRVTVGDTARLTLRNPAESAAGHSIDFHASQVAWNDEMRTIAPGESLTYEFHRNPCRHLDVSLRHVAGAAPHRQRHVWRDHRRCARAVARGRSRVRVRASEFYVGPQG